MKKKIENHSVIRINEFEFRVVNAVINQEYFVNLLEKNCTCPRFKYTKKNGKGVKKKCKHIRIAENLRSYD